MSQLDGVPMKKVYTNVQNQLLLSDLHLTISHCNLFAMTGPTTAPSNLGGGGGSYDNLRITWEVG